MTFSLAQLQSEHLPWARHNFGEQPAWVPLLGICEEVGELIGALSYGNDAEILDAVGDIVIFAADYCNAMRWDLAAIESRKSYARPDFRGVEIELAFAVGKVQHHHLKAYQGIRRNEDHEGQGRFFLGVVLYWLGVTCNRLQVELIDVVAKTWDEVARRDWKTSDEHS